MFAALFQTTTGPSPQPRDHTKRHRSREDDDTLSTKRDHLELEAARSASLIDEAWQMRVHEVADGASSSMIADVERSTTEGVIIVANTIDVSLLQKERVSENRTRQLVDHRHYAPQVCFTDHLILYFVCIVDNYMLFC